MTIVPIVEEQGRVPQATLLITETANDGVPWNPPTRFWSYTANESRTTENYSQAGMTINHVYGPGYWSYYKKETYVVGFRPQTSTSEIISSSFYETNLNEDSYAYLVGAVTTTVSPLTGRSGSLSFSTTTTNIISAKDTTLGTSTDTYTSLTTIYSSTTSSVPKVPYVSSVSTYSNRTILDFTYTEMPQYYGTKELVYSTRYVVSDNSDGVTLALATAGNGGIVSYRALSEGEVVGEQSYKFVTYNSQIFSEPFEASDHFTTQTSVFSTTSIGIETVVNPDFNWEYDGYDNSTMPVIESSLVYSITATANRGFIGTYDTKISSTSVVNYYAKTAVITSTENRVVGDATITVLTNAVTTLSNITTTIYTTNGAFVADGGATLFITTATARLECVATSQETITRLLPKPYAVVRTGSWINQQKAGNVIEAEVITKDIIPWRQAPFYHMPVSPGFILEPVGPPCIGGYNATTPQGLGFDDNCPYSFPASLLWEAANDDIYAAVAASSYYIGGVPLISHEKQWEWQGRTYAWLSLNANGGALRVDSGGTATPSSSFTIKVTGDCTYTGCLSEMHAGGRYYSKNAEAKATLVANSPLIVSVENTTSSFAVGTHEITQPMKILPDQYGSVVLAGLVSIYPPNLKNNPNAE